MIIWLGVLVLVVYASLFLTWRSWSRRRCERAGHQWVKVEGGWWCRRCDEVTDWE